MGLKKLCTFPSARMAVTYLLARYKDLAIVDCSTGGHVLFNFGHSSRLSDELYISNIFSAPLTDNDISLGNYDILLDVLYKIRDKGFKNIVIVQSAIGSIINIDYDLVLMKFKMKNIFILNIKLNADFYVAVGKSIIEIYKHIKEKNFKGYKGDGFCILGSNFSFQGKINHRYLVNLIENKFLEKCKFDNLNDFKFNNFKNIFNSKFNIITSMSLLGIGKQLNENCGIPYIYFSGIGIQEEIKFIEEVSKTLLMKTQKTKDCSYDYVFQQFKNIIQHTKLRIVCYMDEDILFGLRGFFNRFDNCVIEYYCFHNSLQEKYMECNEFIEKFKNQECCIISNSEICSYFNKGVVLDYLGLSYRLLTPEYPPTIGRSGAYNLMKSIVDCILD